MDSYASVVEEAREAIKEVKQVDPQERVLAVSNLKLVKQKLFKVWSKLSRKETGEHEAPHNSLIKEVEKFIEFEEGDETLLQVIIMLKHLRSYEEQGYRKYVLNRKLEEAQKLFDTLPASVRGHEDVGMIEEELAGFMNRIYPDDQSEKQSVDSLDSKPIHITVQAPRVLPPIPPPQFDGTLDSYPSWSDDFTGHLADCNMSDLGKKLLLSESVANVPRAKEIVDDAQSYEEARKRMQDKYYKPKLVCDQFLLQLAKFNSFEDSDVLGLFEFAKFVKKQVTVIERHKMGYFLDHQWFIFRIQDILPPAHKKCVRSLDAELSIGEQRDRVVDYIYWLEIDLEEQLSAANNGSTRVSTARINAVSGKFFKCQFNCGVTSYHAPYKCPLWRKLSLVEKGKKVRAWNLCLICVVSHEGKACGRAARWNECAVCKQKHTKGLCGIEKFYHELVLNNVKVTNET